MTNGIPDTNEKITPKKIVYEENKKLDNINNNLKITTEITTGTTLTKNSSDKHQKKNKFKVEKKSNIKGPIFIIDKSTGGIKKKKGRRNKNSFRHLKKTTHSNLYCDNMFRKIKSWTISSIIKFINKKLLYEGNESGKKKIKKKFLRKFYTIIGTLTNNIALQYNRDLLQKKISEILSNNVSKKTKVKEEYNSKLIDEIRKDNKYTNVINILDLTFLQCINHLIGKERIECLIGFEEYYQEKKEASISNLKRFNQFVNNIEKFLFDGNFRAEMNNQNKNLK